QANRNNILLARTLQDRFESWKEKSNSTEQRQFIDWFSADPMSLHKHLMAFRVLRSYPSIGVLQMGNAFSILSALKLQLHDLAVDENSIPEAVTQVTYQLNEYQPNSIEELSAMVDQVSGLLWVEFETLETILLSHPDWISTTILDQMEIKFESFSLRISKRLAELRSKIRPTKPQEPDAHWNIQQMLEWAIDTYLPYQAWCSAQEQFDKEVFTLGDQFSEWLMDNWNDIQSNSKRMVFNILPNIASELNDPDLVHLILVVDNLGWSFSKILSGIFQEKGFHLQRSEPYIAMLPTETETSKKCLLSAAVGYTAIDDNTYKGILESGWVPFLNQSNTFRYISDIGRLNRVDIIDARAYVVNYLAVDKAMHKSNDEIGMSHQKHVRYLLEELVQNAMKFISKHDLEEKIRIHIVSDHGSTQIPADIQNDIDQSFYKQSGFEARSHRYLDVSNERFASLADNLKHDCFFLPANDFLLSTNVLCARRANRFLPTDKRSFVHGGLLPEEVIVPYMAFEPATVPVKDLTIVLQKSTFRYRLETMKISIGNPNTTAIENIRLTALNSNVELDFEPIPTLSGLHDKTLETQARFKLSALPEEQTHLSLRIRFRCRGEVYAFDVKLPIEMRKMVEEKSSSIFDDI
ncbi:hypothetical protein ACFLTX_04085, partial [Chloroflexota bacterium]